MILNSPFPLKGSLPLLALFSAIVTVLIRLAFTHDSIEWGERYKPFTGFITSVISFFILFTAFFMAADILFPGVILRSFTDTAGLELFRLLLPLLVSYTLLWFLIPLLRKYFHPAFCAVCWTLPNIVYFTFSRSLSPLDNLIILPVKASVLKTVSLVWLAGFLAVMIYRVTSHLRFRKALLASATEITEGHVYDLYMNLLKEFRCQKTYRLGITPALNTPLTVGIEESTTIIFLPQKEYSDEQLDLILRHELVHIQRRDPYTKYFMTIVNAAGWFIPFTWMTSAKASQDLELSCDQTVIRHCDEEQRKEYANLILSSSCDERGFTTCLAAKAKDLQYRLRGIMKPEKKRYGTVLIFLICFTILSGYGIVSLAEECGTLGEKIRETAPADGNIHISSLSRNGKRKTVADEEGLYRYIASKGIMKIAGKSSFPSDPVSEQNGLTIIYLHIDEETYIIQIFGRQCRFWHAETDQGSWFALKEPIDADVLDSYLN